MRKRYEGVEPGTYMAQAPSDKGSVQVSIEVGDDGTFETTDPQEMFVLENAFYLTPASVTDDTPAEATVAELREELAAKDLPVSGTKAELVERLAEAEGGS